MADPARDPVTAPLDPTVRLPLRPPLRVPGPPRADGQRLAKTSPTAPQSEGCEGEVAEEGCSDRGRGGKVECKVCYDRHYGDS